MKVRNLRSVKLLLSLALLPTCIAPTSQAQPQGSVVPTLVNFKGTLTDLNGRPLSGTVGVTFLPYKDEQGGAPLWMETQNVTPDKNGHYSVMLGSTRSEGLPTDVFTSGKARWLAVQPQGQTEQARVLLLTVPYALKAGDAQTVGGLPASAFVLGAPAAANPSAAATEGNASAATAPPPASSNVTTTGGTGNTIPMFTTGTNIQNSILTQTGTTAVNVGGKLNLPATGTTTSGAGFISRSQDLVASAYNRGTKAAVAPTFQLQAEPAGNDTTTPAGTLNLLYGVGAATPAETGLTISNKGLIPFATGQTFPGTGTGTVKSVGLSAPSSDFKVSGSPVADTGTLSLAWNVAPTSTKTANAIVKGDASGDFSAGTISAGTVNASEAIVTYFFLTSSSPTPTYFYRGATDADTVWGVAGSSTGSAVGVEGETYSTVVPACTEPPIRRPETRTE